MNNKIININDDIQNKIYFFKGKEVMLDSDLALLYKCKNGTKEINQAVKNNINKFPERYAFRISESEYNSLKSIFLTSKGGSRKGHTVFTEQGVAMLATILKSDTAISTSIKIMDAFVTMRHTLLNNTNYQRELFIIQNKILEHDIKIEGLIDKFSTEDIFKNKLIFKGEFYDSFSLILNIFNKAKKEIIVIDNYCDKEILNLICDLKVNVLVISNNMNSILINKYKKQYNNLTIIQDNSFHDRFIIIDKEIGYHLGSSIKDIGKKISYIDNINKKWLDLLLKEIKR